MTSVVAFQQSESPRVTKYGSITICGKFTIDKPHMVSCMASIDILSMADDRRGLLTPREREILSGEADVSEEYYYSVVSRVRSKIRKIEEDAELLRDQGLDLHDELIKAVSEDGEDDE